jgi:hypothetical protein
MSLKLEGFMVEDWINLAESGFTNYAVSNLGQIRNEHTGRIVSRSSNQSGVCKVNLYDDRGGFVSRSLALLVATYFLPYQGSIFNTPINLNGDRLDNRSCNLAWRPRWFALRYHKQFERPAYRFKYRIKLLDSGEVFANAREASTAYGLLEDDIANSFANNESIWPYHFRFEELR